MGSELPVYIWSIVYIQNLYLVHSTKYESRVLIKNPQAVVTVFFFKEPNQPPRTSSTARNSQRTCLHKIKNTPYFANNTHPSFFVMYSSSIPSYIRHDNYSYSSIYHIKKTINKKYEVLDPDLGGAQNTATAILDELECLILYPQRDPVYCCTVPLGKLANNTPLVWQGRSATWVLFGLAAPPLSLSLSLPRRGWFQGRSARHARTSFSTSLTDAVRHGVFLTFFCGDK